VANYKEFGIDEFLQDEYFVRWVKHPDKESSYFWHNWMKQNPEKQQEIQRAIRIINSVKSDRNVPTEKESNEVLESILNQLDQYDGKVENKRHYLNTFYKVAASVIILLGFYFLADHYIANINTSQEQVGHADIEKSTKKGQKLSFNLPDGSMVKLNAESKLIVEPGFGIRRRAVRLEGEAFFEVVRDESKPFIIQIGELEVEVLGTSFNVNGYKEDNRTLVAVVSGIVQVNSLASETSNLLAAEQMLTYNNTDKSVKVSNYNQYDIVGWKDNIIYFKDAGFNEIRKTLERWYDVEFSYQNGLSPVEIRENFTATFRNESLEKVLDALNYTSKFEYELMNNTVYVKPK